MARRTAREIRDTRGRQERLVALTAYDAPMARLADEAGVDIILVGDSVATTVLGMESTVDVGMSEMLHHCRAVVRGSARAHIVLDLPFMSYQAHEDDAVYNAGRALKEGGAQSVKLEGGARFAPLVARLVDAGIPVMGHIGLQPQSVNQTGYATQGRDIEGAEGIIRDALALADAGVFAMVLEKIPAELAQYITNRVSVPTIGIGSGPSCDGQVLVVHDLLGLDDRHSFRHAKEYLSLAGPIREAIGGYVGDVRSGVFPGEEQTVHANDALTEFLGKRS
jgi:3-methyl-2-oxobutanoate hydroxymethyltransferase